MKNFTANFTLFASDGFPYTETTGLDNNQDGIVNDRPAGVGIVRRVIRCLEDPRMRLFKGTLVALALSTPLIAQSPPSVDWSSVQTETMQHSQALLQLDTSDPPGNESLAATYLQQVQQREGIPVQLFEDRAALGLTPADDGQLAWECCPER